MSKQTVTDKFLCPFPWMSPCVTTDGHFRVCPVSQSALTKGVVRNFDGTKPHISELQKITDITNADSLKQLRKKMLLGEDVADTCRRCLVEESHGLQSRRQMELVRIPEFTENFIHQHTSSDGHLKEDSPIATLILRMGNKCNLVCRMCGPSSSSAWYKEWLHTRHSGFHEEDGRISLSKNAHGTVMAQPNPYDWSESDGPEKLVTMCGPSLRRIHFSGGEPLLSRGHLNILRHLVASKKAAQISLDYNSNLTVLSEEVLELWSHFEEVEIGLSMDGPPEINEYIRYPLKSNKWLDNLRRLDESNVRGKFWLSTTVQIYNILYLKDLEEWLAQQNFKKIKSEISWHVLRSPKELSIFALPQNLKERVSNELSVSKSFSPISKMIFEENYSAHFAEFISTTKSMDDYRNQSIEKLDKLWDLVAEHFV